MLKYPSIVAITAVFSWFLASFSTAQSLPEGGGKPLETCVRTFANDADGDMTIAELKAACRSLIEEPQAFDATELSQPDPKNEPESDSIRTAESSLLLSKRLRIEALNRANRFMLTPHRRNYLLPISFQPSPNREPYLQADSGLTDLQKIEVEFQLSVKILMREAVLGDNGHLYMAYTNHSLWQAYNRDLSRPFRETNHQSELILSFINDWEILGFRNVLNEVILNHQSNGQSGLLSRSWNRVMLNTVFERAPFAVQFTPWYRIPEAKAEFPGDPRGDDNPDIEKYLGNFELSGAYQRKDHILSVALRNNMRSDNKGAVTANWTFPVSSTVRGYVKYFNGYGHSLIDYDVHTQALGLGISFTDLF